jgi:2-oxoglutarate dehydrogenase E1 component
MFLWWPKVDTTFHQKKLKKLGEQICEVPNSFNLGTQASKIFDDRRKMNEGSLEINWGFAESMSYASLLSEGYPIR